MTAPARYCLRVCYCGGHPEKVQASAPTAAVAVTERVPCRDCGQPMNPVLPASGEDSHPGCGAW